MSILETIRNRAGVLIVIMIGGAMLVFILEDALSSGRFFFGGNQNTVAIVNGKKIDFQDMNAKVENLEAIQKISRGVEALDNQTMNQIEQSVYQEMVSKLIMEPEYKKLGISVPDSELVDMMLGSHPAPELTQYFTDQRTGQLYKPFVDPRTGGINMTTVVEYVKEMNDTAQLSWDLLEKQVRERQLQTKYLDLVKDGLFVTDAEAKQAVLDQNQYYNIHYVLQKYSTVSSNDVKVSDEDIQNYYNKHLYEYNQQEESRKIDYVTFYAAPTDKDLSNLQKEADSLAHTFKTLKPSEDSAFVVAESDNHMLDPNYHKVGSMAPSIDSVMSHADVGYVYGPFKENNQIRIAKLMDIAYLPDSVRARHILIRPTANTEDAWKKAKAKADSLKKIVTKENFAEIATKNSQDPGSAVKGGDLGWFTQGKMVPEFDHACFFGDKGDIVEVQSEYGYHLIYIEDQSKKFKSVHVGMIVKNIAPSTETLNNVFGEASAFAGKNATSDAFENSAGKMNKRVADLKENDQNIPGIQEPKDLIRWAYTAKTGDISSVFDVGGNKYIVAHLMQVTPKGTIPLDQVRDQVKEKAMQEKKAEKIIADMKAAMQGTTSIAALGQKLNSPAATASHLAFAAYNIPGLGKEDALLGTMTAIKPNTLSQPIEGQLGVYVIQVDSVYTTGATDYKVTQQQQEQAMQNRAQYDLFEALQKKAGVVNHMGKFY